jgi:hypothetical protein
MSTIAQQRQALVTAVSGTDGPISPPCAVVVSNGSDLASLGGESAEWGFRVVVYAGLYSDNAAMEDTLAALVIAKLAALRSLAGCRILSVSGSLIRESDGGRLLAADIAVSMIVTLT